MMPATWIGMYESSLTQTRFPPTPLKSNCRASRFGAIGWSWLEFVVEIRRPFGGRAAPLRKLPS
jgi:hypothetical protein